MATRNEKQSKNFRDVVIHFSGDSGDGIQLLGSLFSNIVAQSGNDARTYPDFPAEIRAPKGTVGGVSGFQIKLGNHVSNPGNEADVFVALNPAALKANENGIKKGGVIIYDQDTFDEKNAKIAGYQTEDPFNESSLGDRTLVGAPISFLTSESLKDSGLDNKSIARCKNMFALGLTCWLFDKNKEAVFKHFETKFSKKPQLLEANKIVFDTGYNYGDTVQAMVGQLHVAQAQREKGTYRMMTGNRAVAWGMIAAAQKASKELFLGSYPITPATEILQYLSERKDMGVKTFQAEDEIAGICSAIGAAFAGNLALTTTSGPGLALKGEAVGLAVMAELPLVIVNVQRGGPSTGLPTKTEQADLMQALYGRNGESPCVVVAPISPAHCFEATYWAAKVAVERMLPVIVLTDGYIANSSEPWRIPSMSELPEITPRSVSQKVEKTGDFLPYWREEKTLARDWAIPGTEKVEHRIGGLEKSQDGNVSHDGPNHEMMINIREEKVKRIVEFVPDARLEGDPTADTLLVGWGGTYGHLIAALEELNANGQKTSLLQVAHVKPLPANLPDLFSKFSRIIVCELNKGQFASYLRSEFPQFTYEQFNIVQGRTFHSQEIIDRVTQKV